ncbi:COX15/CtaA family protein [Geodermatophilus obscurus]|uniref:Cytochrome oxidase assembly n=1 Tax=Geodermatophilus obscurus (strain ATCC 25078 / DSM 43160 / JCM 3152 / CCUG 61914 / KCC A-0152 / KCTC 9177 / NBRC 13315 / NRRL B-3577 / G-20) TaxID=526225 RepID=D2SF59_GEOOG|nr:COX15/CtaA family protein [Geodermatophilus obscurus]ADB74749.1 cytochrome oxidase assembly [Geodermatophilus obscurus DSM 43160]
MPVSPAVVSRLALANAVANGAIVVTGGAVRLTGSGLGCPTWPRCTSESFVATPELAGHGVIEFGNRLLTFVLAAVAIATVVAVWRSERRDLRPLAVLTFLGIPAQALLGGVTVLTGLNPWTVAAHFLVSIVLIALATVLWLRSREPGVGRPLLRRPLALLVTGAAAVTAVVLVLGTLVTGSGPHSGDVDADDVPTGDRMGFDVELVSQLHADAVFLLVGLTVALLVSLYATDAPGRVKRAARDLLVVQLAQGVVGYVQYFTDLPVALVLLHMLGAVLVTAFTARLVWSVRGPASELPLHSPLVPASAAR